ncbi:MAG: hypothetical protein ACM3JC_15175 [Rudaea sp.]
MASSLTGLRRTLTWNDFTRKDDVSRPQPGDVAMVAQTRAVFAVQGLSSGPVDGSRPTAYKLADRVKVVVRLKRDECWVAAWVVAGSTSGPERQRLLKHEQGHYDIVALLARDMLAEITAVAKNLYASAQEPIDDANAVMARYDPYYDSVQELYDEKTNHGDVRNEQQRWNGFLLRAFGGIALLDVLHDLRIMQ